jgi:hypothetical protein
VNVSKIQSGFTGHRLIAAETGIAIVGEVTSDVLGLFSPRRCGPALLKFDGQSLFRKEVATHDRGADDSGSVGAVLGPLAIFGGSSNSRKPGVRSAVITAVHDDGGIAWSYTFPGAGFYANVDALIALPNDSIIAAAKSSEDKAAASDKESYKGKLIKLSSGGKLEWQRTFAEGTVITSLAETADGKLLLAGRHHAALFDEDRQAADGEWFAATLDPQSGDIHELTGAGFEGGLVALVATVGGHDAWAPGMIETSASSIVRSRLVVYRLTGEPIPDRPTAMNSLKLGHHEGIKILSVVSGDDVAGEDVSLHSIVRMNSDGSRGPSEQTVIPRAEEVVAIARRGDQDYALLSSARDTVISEITDGAKLRPVATLRGVKGQQLQKTKDGLLLVGTLHRSQAGIVAMLNQRGRILWRRTLLRSDGRSLRSLPMTPERVRSCRRSQPATR